VIVVEIDYLSNHDSESSFSQTKWNDVNARSKMRTHQILWTSLLEHAIEWQAEHEVTLV